MIKAEVQYRPRNDAGQFVSVHISPAVRKSVEEACAMIETRAKELCPVDTGALRASITTDVKDLNRTIRGEVGPHVYYAAYVEYGTGIAGAASPGAGEGPYSPTWPGMPAQPYMRPALDEKKPEIEEIFKNNLGAVLG